MAGIHWSILMATILCISWPTTSSQGCSDDQFQCTKSRKCISKKQTCDFLTDCMEGMHIDFSDESECASCGFETNTCGWKDGSRGNYAWTRIQTLDRSASTIPNKETGFAMALTRKPGSFYSSAVLRSPSLGPTGKPCTLQFFYKKRSVCSGVNKEDLQVWQVNGSNKKLIWSDCKGNGLDWSHVMVKIPQVPRGFHLEFRLAAMRGPTGDVLIDDVTMGLCGKDMRGYGVGDKNK